MQLHTSLKISKIDQILTNSICCNALQCSTVYQSILTYSAILFYSITCMRLYALIDPLFLYAIIAPNSVGMIIATRF